MRHPERPEEISRRRLLVGSLLGAAALSAGLVLRPRAGLAAEPKRGGTLRLGQVGGVLNFDGHRLSWGNYPMLNQSYNTLLRYDGELRPQPELAEGWTFGKDGRTLDFQLRRGVLFHNGREFVADDVVWNITRAQDPKVAAHVRPMALAIKKAEAPDRDRVVLSFDRPTPAILDLFDAMSIIGREGEADLKQKPLGTGPFQLVTWVPGDRAVFKRFPQYFRKGLPYLDEVVLQQVPDAAALVINLEAGAIDMAFEVPPRDAVRLRDHPRIRILQTFPGATVFDIMLNVTRPPFDKKAVRQAINHAVDRKRFVDTILLGIGEPWCQPFPRQSLGYAPDLGTAHCEFNLTRAKQLLAEAGHPNGFEATLHISTATFPLTRQLAQILQSDLAKIGVRLAIRDVEPAEYREVTWGERQKFAIVLHQFGRANRDPDSLFKGAGAWYAEKGMTLYTSPEYRQLIDEAGGTTDAGKRRQLYGRLARLIADEAFTLPLAPNITLYGHQAYVQGPRLDVEGRVSLEGAWLDR
ncbi:MAG TPA: ABC transporter substrate-binding protein [Methylomirabilota bacterium]|nr:ABC transporter substrate-binding protein [Methylomirabilota bacterium]